MADQDLVIEGETVEESPGTDNSSSQILLNMEGLIKNHITTIDKLSEELKKHKEMLDDIFSNDKTYQEHLEKAKEASKIKQVTRQQILRQPQAGELDKKVKEMKAQIKENQQSLSDYLQEYARMSGVSEIEGDDGEVREIVYSAKLRKKSSIFAR
ncbi:MAG: hypothetical protein ACD_30C00052G0016 [uncultured bacterium]|uniref:Uncharacterized protein n=4 Tax=Candidatus Daviesiibacteriota TaxID=1752718 RepID=A0A0G0HAT9_9BACT|nr:MAG: hypothetical protein ACD_30C00052G0016 [uncultured bacterium]KKQ09199.1 MAG: hypothetical protein US19_C0016G0022 [Candidatus Daviesbacteria bacterium GW2011_GWB1_36_5]KKQ14797.1 MAG: hypothetical protein US28_C0029G0022 [Candidatus Daviesbacteria bacterium GW2011_GWA1_36_8]OGE16433.1 MAG: hypothetical protein A2858_01700 [Candidatus Daviesbacteria bacterium RIFCSPHIGHO2_01_FULL_36_37]OGE35319.1 MAG: hypothetical protein A3E66_00495 [Candidatus Daviesbacteria bacterium RIFCSPHIGHO2_12_F